MSTDTVLDIADSMDDVCCDGILGMECVCVYQVQLWWAWSAI